MNEFLYKKYITTRMPETQLPRISVIITAYNRREFLLNAIESAVNQTLDKKFYEIIVIKNYQDDTIDNYIAKNNVIGLISDDKSLGGKLAEALNIASGDVISFLEDDDIFADNKLEVVYNKFKDNGNLCYYHNDNIPIDDKYRKKNANGNKGIAFNMSSISVKKSILNLNKLKRINDGTDHFMYLCALESDKWVINGKEKLTYYMYHNSASNFIVNNFKEFKKYRIEHTQIALNLFLTFREMFISKRSVNYINAEIINYEIDGYFYGSDKTPENLINFFKNNPRPFSSNVMRFLAYLFVRFNRDSRDMMAKKLWEFYKKDGEIMQQDH